MSLEIKFRFWIFDHNEKVLGKGRIELLELIQHTGSISRAAAGMKMSYRQAWQMVNEMNERSGKVLVEKQLGGKSGGGAVVTKAGEKAIANYNEINNKLNAFIKREFRKIKL